MLEQSMQAFWKLSKLTWQLFHAALQGHLNGRLLLHFQTYDPLSEPTAQPANNGALTALQAV